MSELKASINYLAYHDNLYPFENKDENILFLFNDNSEDLRNTAIYKLKSKFGTQASPDIYSKIFSAFQDYKSGQISFNHKGEIYTLVFNTQNSNFMA